MKTMLTIFKTHMSMTHMQYIFEKYKDKLIFHIRVHTRLIAMVLYCTLNNLYLLKLV